MKKRQLRLFILFLGLALILSGSPMILAQENTGGDSEASEEFMLEEITVTGSRIVREQGFGQTSPVTVIGANDIESIGFTRIEDVLNSLPQIESTYYGTAYISNGSTGTATLDLRGLGSERTLVLINGRRMQPGGTWIYSPDINQIPASMVEKVEVLTGGASATYGADAVAGVVNFIMRKVDGVELNLNWSAYQHNNDNKYIQGLMDDAGYPYPKGGSGFDGAEWDIDFLAGSEFAGDKGHATVYFTWKKNNELLQSQRDYSSCALWSGDPMMCGGSMNAPIPNYIIWADNPAVGEEGMGYFTLQPDSSIAELTDNFYNYGPINHFLRPQDNYTAGAFVDLAVNEHANVYVELQFADNKSRAQIAESGTFGVSTYTLPLSSALFPDAFRNSLAALFPDTVAADPDADFNIRLYKRNVEGGGRIDVTRHTSYRMVAGVKGPITDMWDYDVSYLKATTNSSAVYLNDFLMTALDYALDPDQCTVGVDCYDVFEYGGITPDEVTNLTGIGTMKTDTSTEMFTAQINGDLGLGLPAGNILVAGGYEYRRDIFDRQADSVYELGQLLGQGGPTPSITGSFSVNEFFGEAKIPLLKDMPAAQNVTADLAYRRSNYSTVGETNTYRLGLDWQFMDQFRVRTGYNRAVRAPDVTELFLPQNIGLWGGVDPCTGTDPEYTAEQCARTGVTALQYGNLVGSPAQQYNAMFGGNPNLDPETADTFTLGFVTHLFDVSFSVDYWNIRIKDTIDTVDAELVLDLCALNNQLCDSVHRDAFGNLWLGYDGWVDEINQNIGEQSWQGIDIAAAYHIYGLGGDWNADLVGTYMIEKETTPIAGDASTTYDCVGQATAVCYPSPKWRHTLSVSYDSNDFWSVIGRWRFFGGVSDPNAYPFENDQMSSQSYFDLNGQFKFWGNHDIMIGVNNVLDKEPPLLGDMVFGELGNANTFAGFWDTLGRYVYAKVTFRF